MLTLLTLCLTLSEFLMIWLKSALYGVVWKRDIGAREDTDNPGFL